MDAFVRRYIHEEISTPRTTSRGSRCWLLLVDAARPSLRIRPRLLWKILPKISQDFARTLAARKSSARPPRPSEGETLRWDTAPQNRGQPSPLSRQPIEFAVIARRRNAVAARALRLARSARTI